MISETCLKEINGQISSRSRYHNEHLRREPRPLRSVLFYVPLYCLIESHIRLEADRQRSDMIMIGSNTRKINYAIILIRGMFLMT